MRHTAFAVPRRPRHPGRRMADDGLRPFPPYASFITGGGLTGHGSQREMIATEEHGNHGR
ncbi:hypothetical protein [Thioalkalivibrio nitratireducens]|uniref:hypothetical protein n=1 Tax=Thioalkalivibrio nitratireducens TaxID=186931 RepID=UPI0009F88FA2|nr:hypothetical protein [Thioalkalivibrio nitratireducens]